MASENGVYVKNKNYGWLPVHVILMEEDTISVSVSIPGNDGDESIHNLEKRIIKLKEYDDNALPLQNIDESGDLIEMPDMCDLPSLHEAAILYNLKIRHQHNKPYTRAGDIVIAMNPFKGIDQLYSEETRGVYVEKLIKDGKMKTLLFLNQQLSIRYRCGETSLLTINSVIFPYMFNFNSQRHW